MTSFVVWPSVGCQLLCPSVVFLAPVHGSCAAEHVLGHAEVESILGASLLARMGGCSGLEPCQGGFDRGNCSC